MEYLSSILQMPLFTLFIIIAMGMWLGSIKVRGISLGAAGVLFVALLFGHIRADILRLLGETGPEAAERMLTIPRELTDLGLLLFVFAVGLQAGPRFFSVFRARGKSFLAVGFLSVTVGAAATFALAKAMNLSPALASGLFTGAVTNTPALAAARDVVKAMAPGDLGTVSVGYGVAYPFSVISITLLVQVLPTLLRIRPVDAAAQARAAEAEEMPPLEKRKYRVTNPNCDGKTIGELQGMRLSLAKISRVKHGGIVATARPDTSLHLEDVVLAVGSEEELHKLETLLGHVVDESMTDTAGNIASEEIVVSREHAYGKPLRSLRPWEEFGVVVTRVRREGMEFSPTGQTALVPGDVLRVVGERDDVAAFATSVGQEERRLQETSLVPFAAGIALGVAIGLIPLSLPGGLSTRIGMGAATFIVALLMGHFGRIGPIQVYVPAAAKMLARELGLVGFLAGAGLEAGEKFMEVLHTSGPQLLLAGAAVTVVTALTALFIMHRLLRWNMLGTAGALSATMTNPPALAASNGLADSDAPAIAFASVYPVAIISKILYAQALFLALRL